MGDESVRSTESLRKSGANSREDQGAIGNRLSNNLQSSNLPASGLLDYWALGRLLPGARAVGPTHMGEHVDRQIQAEETLRPRTKGGGRCGD